MIMPEWLFLEPIENPNNIPRRIYIFRPLREKVKEYNKIDDKQLNKELAKKMNNPYYFTDRALQVGFNIYLDSHYLIMLTVFQLINQIIQRLKSGLYKILREMAPFYARLINQYKFKIRTAFSARLDKQDEDGQILDEIELYINVGINRNLTRNIIDNNNLRFQLEREILNQEMKDSGWKFDEINSMTYFCKITEMNRSNYVKFHLRFSGILNIESDDKFGFFWLILATLYPFQNNRPNGASNYRQ